MIRAPMGDHAYWDKWTSFQISNIEDRTETLKQPSGDPSYRPQYVFNLAKEHWHLILYRYSRGDSIRELAQYFRPLLDAWEESNRLHLQFRTEQELRARRNWSANLDHYIVCFWLVGLALALDIPNVQWQRLLTLIGNEGEDELLDRIIATRQPMRRIGTKLCHPKPYQRLLDAINAPKDKQPKLLFAFVNNWYKELDRPPKKGLSEQTAMYDRPYWYKYHNPMGGAYFGYWCIEAVAAVKAFGLDDSLCLGHPNYPGDLLRPDGPSTHPKRPDETSATRTPTVMTSRPAQKGWLARLLGRD